MIRFNTVQEYINKLNNAFHLLVGVPLLPFALLYLEISAERIEPATTNMTFIIAMQYIIPFYCLLITGLAILRFRRELGEMRKQEALKDKLMLYFNASMIKYVLVFSGSIVAVFGLLMTTSHLYSVMYLITLFTFSLNRPTLRRISRDLKLEGEDKEIILNKGDLK